MSTEGDNFGIHFLSIEFQGEDPYQLVSLHPRQDRGQDSGVDSVLPPFLHSIGGTGLGSLK